MSPRRILVALLAVIIIVVVLASIFVLRSPREVAGPPSDFGDRAVFIGDSYTHGTGASSESFRWTSLVAAQRGWQETNLGLGGTGYLTASGPKGCGLPRCPSYRTVVAQAVAAQPDVVVVAGGQNDFKSFESDPGRVTKAIDQTYADLHRDLPDTRLIAVGPSTPGQVNATVTAFDSAVESAARANGATFISLIRPTPVLTPEMALPDRTHVDDDGHRAIADRVLAGLG